MNRLLRKKDLVQAVGVAKSTVADWITEFQIFVPTVKNGAVTYYRPEALEVLQAIREFRELDYSKVQIMELLAKKGFPVTVEEAAEDANRILVDSDHRDGLFFLMQNVGQAMTEIGKHEERLKLQSDLLNGQGEKVTETAYQVLALQKTVLDLESRLEEAQKQIIAIQQKNKRWWQPWRK